MTVHSIDFSRSCCHHAAWPASLVSSFPALPHHVTQRGNGRERTFFGDDDYALYRDLLARPAAPRKSKSGRGA